MPVGTRRHALELGDAEPERQVAVVAVALLRRRRRPLGAVIEANALGEEVELNVRRLFHLEQGLARGRGQLRERGRHDQPVHRHSVHFEGFQDALDLLGHAEDPILLQQAPAVAFAASDDARDLHVLGRELGDRAEKELGDSVYPND